jgi:CRISP-associated protein Cas1
MSGTTLPRSVITPSGVMIPRVIDQLSYCYLQMCRIVQDDTGVAAHIETTQGPGRTYLPTAAIACLLLGPGTNITRDAVITFTRHGTHIVFVGTAGVRCYSTFTGATDSRHLMRMATIATNEAERLTAAKHLYLKRFPMELPTEVTLDQLRGLEGARMKATYRTLAKRYGIRFTRQYTPGDLAASDTVNIALTAGNAALYGIVGAALGSLGIHPGLGIVHSGTSRALIYDIADLYKTELVLPLAFALHQSTNPERDMRAAFRDKLTLLKLMPRIVHDILELLGEKPDVEPALQTQPDLSLWDPDHPAIAAGMNHAKV